MVTPKEGHKYRPLYDLLVSGSRSGETIVHFTFAELDQLVWDGKQGLPPSARNWNRNIWWANDSPHHSQCRAWQGAGWTVAVDFTTEIATFMQMTIR